MLGLAGTALAGAAMFVNYDGFSSLWSELPESESAEFFFEPASRSWRCSSGSCCWAPARGSRPGCCSRSAGATALHYARPAHRRRGAAIGEAGDIRAAGYIGVVGSLLVTAAAALAARSRVSA